MSILDPMVTGEAPELGALSVGQYHDMIANGILREGDPIELIDGLLVRKDRADKEGDPMSVGPGHASGARRLQKAWRPAEGLGFFLHSQLPVTLRENQEPEPDQALVRGQPAQFDRRLPTAADTAAIAEVSASSLAFDRTTKHRLYATAGIPGYWIVNLIDRQLEVHTEPRPTEGKYADCIVYKPGQTVTRALGSTPSLDESVADLIPE